jgi:uncharacterized OB-fold protein
MMAKHFHTLRHDVWLPYRFAVGDTFNRFYEGLKAEKILGNNCPECGKILVPARTFCPTCFVDMGQWVEVSQEGDVVSWTVCNDDFFDMPSNPPFIGALIRLDGTSCNFLHLIGGFALNDPDTVKSKVKRGSRVKAVWNVEKKGHLLDIKYFKPL